MSVIEDVEIILKSRYPPDLVASLLDSYSQVKEYLLLRKFKPGELEAGFFVESVRRILEFELLPPHTPIGTNLPVFGDKEMKRYEDAAGDESFRLHIPRVLKSIYNLRNKRGVGHLSLVIANTIDCTYIAAACDWVLAELVRLTSTLPFDECQRLVERIVARRVPAVFKVGTTHRVLRPNLRKRDQVLLLLLDNGAPVQAKTLQSWVEYRNPTDFHFLLKSLHKERLIEYSADGTCTLTPLGEQVAEDLL
ncbi:MAG: hypothetical protein ACM3WU_11090 [Bacillota bacterium]